MFFFNGFINDEKQNIYMVMKKIDYYANLYLNTANDSNLLLITVDSVTFVYVYTIMIATIIIISRNKK